MIESIKNEQLQIVATRTNEQTHHMEERLNQVVSLINILIIWEGMEVVLETINFKYVLFNFGCIQFNIMKIMFY